MKTLIVHGNSNEGLKLSQDSRDRTDKVIELVASSNYDNIIVTGGLFDVSQNGVTIADAMKHYLENQILGPIQTEPESLTTIHNVELLMKFVSDGDTVVTSDYHVFRTKLIWRLIGKKNVEVIGASSTAKITLKKRVVELVGVFVTLAYWMHIKFPEMLFREAARKI